MARFAIRYKEIYSRTYFVEADTYEDGCNKLEHAIMEGNIGAPYICIDSGYENETKYHLENLEDDDQLDVR